MCMIKLNLPTLYCLVIVFLNDPNGSHYQMFRDNYKTLTGNTCVNNVLSLLYSVFTILTWTKMNGP